MVDTFGQSSPLVAFRDSRPPSSSSSSNNARRQNNGLKSTSPQMYSADAPMATEEYTGTTTGNSSPTKAANSARSNGSHQRNNTARNSSSHAASLLMRKKGLPWLLASALVVIVVLLVLCGFLLYILYEYHGLYSQLDSSSSVKPPAQEVKQMAKGEESSQRPKWPEPNPGSAEVRFVKVAVISENGMCSEIGRKVLLQGGNAVDTAIAVAACVGALNPFASGLGGGFLMTYYQRFYGKCNTIDARETAPSRANKETFKDSPEESYKLVAIPGELHGYWTTFKRFGSGKIAWMDLLMPTANLLNEGFTVSKLMQTILESQKDSIINGTHGGMRSQFVNPATGNLYREGDIMRDATLAGTFKRLALSHDPAQLFYSANGEMARTIADEFANNGGFITRKDLHTYRSFVDDQPLLAIDARQKLVFCGAKPPAGFPITQLILAVMLKLYPPGGNSAIFQESAEYYRHFIEAQKYAYAMSAKIGDIKFDKSSEEISRNMTRVGMVDQIVKKIKSNKLAEVEENQLLNKSNGSQSVIVIDSDGNAVSLTASLGKEFGAFIRSPQLGIVWNDHMDEFSRTNGPKANVIEAGKRPMSWMSPMIVYHKDTRKLKIAISASGDSSAIPSAISQVLTNVLAFNNSLKEAIDAPRLYNNLSNTNYEQTFPEVLAQSLNEYDMTVAKMSAGASVHAILVDEGQLIANNDYRKEVQTHPVGY